jgi:hypothetical protein
VDVLSELCSLVFPFTLLEKGSLKSDDQQFHQYQQYKQSPPICTAVVFVCIQIVLFA